MLGSKKTISRFDGDDCMTASLTKRCKVLSSRKVSKQDILARETLLGVLSSRPDSSCYGRARLCKLARHWYRFIVSDCHHEQLCVAAQGAMSGITSSRAGLLPRTSSAGVHLHRPSVRFYVSRRRFRGWVGS